MIRIAIEFALILGAGYVGKRCGSALESKAIAGALQARSYVGTEVGKAYAAVVADVKAKEQSVLARLKSFL